MEFGGFDWDSGNIEKCQKHGVTLAEIEEVFARAVLVLDDPFDVSLERRFRAIGTTAGGRHIFVVFTLRSDQLRPLSARYMHDKEVKQYETDNPDI
jgi:uncharacterized DUF497 family protein